METQELKNADQLKSIGSIAKNILYILGVIQIIGGIYIIYDSNGTGWIVFLGIVTIIFSALYFVAGNFVGMLTLVIHNLSHQVQNLKECKRTNTTTETTQSSTQDNNEIETNKQTIPTPTQDTPTEHSKMPQFLLIIGAVLVVIFIVVLILTL